MGIFNFPTKVPRNFPRSSTLSSLRSLQRNSRETLRTRRGFLVKRQQWNFVDERERGRDIHRWFNSRYNLPSIPRIIVIISLIPDTSRIERTRSGCEDDAATLLHSRNNLRLIKIPCNAAPRHDNYCTRPDYLLETSPFPRQLWFCEFCANPRSSTDYVINCSLYDEDK